MTQADDLATRGWCRFAHDPKLAEWVAAAHPAALAASRDAQNIKDWLRCGDTWFAGVNILPNDKQGRVEDGPALQGEAIDFVHVLHGPQTWDRAQVSVIYPGYPQPMEGETPAAFKFRRDRDAAHVDGLLPVGPDKQRHLHEPHSFVLGIPLVDTSAAASPMVVWEGSHTIIQQAFRAGLRGIESVNWPHAPLTELYQITRRQCFEQCRRVAVHARPGEAYLIHRLALHGVAPWQDGATAPPEGRMIAYFRPELSDISRWLT